MIYVTDTHAIFWFVTQNPRIGQAARLAISDSSARIVIPTIVLAEVAFLSQRGRINLDLPTLLRFVRHAVNMETYPLDEDTAAILPAILEIHDAIIVATAIALRDTSNDRVAVVTRDHNITVCGLVDVVW